MTHQLLLEHLARRRFPRLQPVHKLFDYDQIVGLAYGAIKPDDTRRGIRMPMATLRERPMRTIDEACGLILRDAYPGWVVPLPKLGWKHL